MKTLWIALALVLTASTYATATLRFDDAPAKTGVIDQTIPQPAPHHHHL